MTVEAKDRERHRHINGFADSFVIPAKRERFRSFLLSPKKRRTSIDGLNHTLTRDIIATYLVDDAPPVPIVGNTYLIADDPDIDDTFVSAAIAIRLLESSPFVIIASIVPGVVAALKEEAPADVRWLHRCEAR